MHPLIISLTLSLSLTPVQMPNPDTCLPLQVVIDSGLTYAKKTDGKFLQFGKNDTDKILKIINDEPPISYFVADKMVAVELKDETRFAFVLKGCVGDFMHMPKDHWKGILIKAFGQGT